MKVLITGGEGHLGRALRPALVDQGHEVVTTDIVPSAALRLDVCSLEAVEQLFELYRPDAVMHLAAVTGRRHSAREFLRAAQVNVVGTMNVAAVCRTLGIKLLHISSSEVYGHSYPYLQPVSYYGETKKLGEDAVTFWGRCGLQCRIVRPFMLYHELEEASAERSAMVRFAQAIWEGRHFEVHDGAARAWLHMKDAALFLTRILEQWDSVPHALDIGHHEMCRMLRLVDLMAANYGREADFTIVACPEDITAVKRPNLQRQHALNLYPVIDLEVGVKRVCARFSGATLAE